MHTVLKIELRNITYNRTLTESAHCFFADLYISDHFVAKVSNLGTDEINDIAPINLRGTRLVHEDEKYLKNLSGNAGDLTVHKRNFLERLSAFIESLLEKHLHEKQIEEKIPSIHMVRQINSGR